jgi:CheY-like chemotaxis protein
MTKALRIVVADDEADVRDYFRRILPHLGHDVVAIASNGRELVDCCLRTMPDLIISDVRMPEMDGDQAIEAICARHPIPFILVSAYSKSIDLPKSLRSSRWHLLTKPITRHELESAIVEVISTPTPSD